MNYDLRRTVQLVATFAFVIALTVWAVLSEIVLPASIKGATKGTILVLSSLGAYQLAYTVAFSLLRTKLSHFLGDRANLSGTWHQVFTVGELTAAKVDYRYGTVLIVADTNGIVLSGENYRPDESFSSHWQSRAVVVEDQCISLFFTSTGLSRGTTSGTMSFLMVGSIPEIIVGTFADSAPGSVSGEIRLYRKKADADAFDRRFWRRPDMSTVGRVRAFRYRRSGVVVSPAAEIDRPAGMQLGRGVCVESRTQIVGSEPGRGFLQVGDRTTFRSGCYISARLGSVQVGEDGYIGHGCWIGGRGIITIGAWFLCAPKVVIISSNHDYRNTTVPYALQTEIADTTTIGDNVWVGANAVILPGAVIGDRSVVAAGSVVRGEVAAGTLVAGVPASVRRRVDDGGDWHGLPI